MHSHRDESGSISVASVFALLFLTMLLGMVINVGRQVDNKIKLQTAADASTYSGGVVLARSMNTLAFTNHMLCEVFALTAIMREARDRHSDPMIQEILSAWDNFATVFSESEFEKFAKLAPHVAEKTPIERKMVETYGDWMAASSDVALPVLETILAEQLIPQLQRDVVNDTPSLAQTATAKIAQEHTGQPLGSDAAHGPILGVLWRTVVEPVGGESESTRGTLPAVDPATDPDVSADDREQAVRDRNRLARHYLNLWNRELMEPFDQHAKMSQFGRLWRGFTCGQLNELFEQYSEGNFPHLIRPVKEDWNTHLDQGYMFVGVAYRQKMQSAMLRLFTDSLTSDNQAFAQGMLFVPRKRPIAAEWHEDPDPLLSRWRFVMTNSPGRWDLWNQDWSFQLVPATSTSIATILQTPPQTPAAAAASSLQLPNLQTVTPADVRRLTTH